MNKKIVRIVTAILALLMILTAAAPSLTTVFADTEMTEELSNLANRDKGGKRQACR